MESPTRTEGDELVDIDGLLADVERVLRDVLSLAESGGGNIEEDFWYGDDGLNVKASFKVGFLDQLPPTYPVPPGQRQEPLIDVLRGKDGFKVLVTLPGVSKEDVRVSVRDRSLVFEINSRGRYHVKEIPCPLPPRSIAVKSVVENNSVVEISFARRVIR